MLCIGSHHLMLTPAYSRIPSPTPQGQRCCKNSKLLRLNNPMFFFGISLRQTLSPAPRSLVPSCHPPWASGGEPGVVTTSQVSFRYGGACSPARGAQGEVVTFMLADPLDRFLCNVLGEVSTPIQALSPTAGDKEPCFLFCLG